MPQNFRDLASIISARPYLNRAQMNRPSNPSNPRLTSSTFDRRKPIFLDSPTWVFLSFLFYSPPPRPPRVTHLIRVHFLFGTQAFRALGRTPHEGFARANYLRAAHEQIGSGPLILDVPTPRLDFGSGIFSFFSSPLHVLAPRPALTLAALSVFCA